MSHSDPQNDRWLHERLHDVPLPEGLLRRLRQIARGGEEQLDRALCEVALPEGLLGRLKDIPAQIDGQLGDGQLDRRLRELSLPAGLWGQLKGIAIAADADLDEAVRDVPVPVELAAQLKKIAPNRRSLAPRRRLSRWAEMALAASLLLMIGGSYLGAMASLLMDAMGTNPPAALTLLREPWEVEIADREPVFVLPALPDAASSPEPLATSNDLAAELARQFDEIIPPGLSIDPLALAPGVSAEDLAFNYRVYAWGGRFFGASRELDDMGALETVSAIVPRGSELPGIAQFDWTFYLEHRVRPFVAPAAEPRLRTSSVPLAVDTHSYDLARRRLRQGKLPAAEDVRVEDFLAAIQYHFVVPQRDAVGIRTAAGPSPLSAHAGTQLLQVGVQAAEKTSLTRRPTHLTVAVDVSASMGWQGRWEMTQQALRSLIGRLGPADLLSIVAYSDEAVPWVEGASADDAEELLAAVETLRPSRSTNVGAGLREACLLAMQGPPRGIRSRRIALLCDGLPRLGDTALRRIGRIVSDANADGITLDVIDLSGDLKTDARLTQLARTGGGTVYPASTGNQVRWGLLQALTGTSEVVASSVRLKVRFFPEAVAAYRLIGHEPGLKTGPLASDLRSGQSATGLYEVVLKPNGVNRVGEAELTWLDPVDGTLHRRTQPISRLQFAPTLREAPLSLQAATLVAATAEILRGSKHVQGKTLTDVLRFIRTEQVNPKLLDWPSFERFRSLAERAERLGGG